MHTVQRINKPSLVDLLRLCDKRRWCQPRIRYASIRSKPELCRDLVQFFDFKTDGNVIVITPKKPIKDFPDLRYDPVLRYFLLDGRRFDAAKVSRQRPQFRLERKKVVLEFGPLYAPDNGTASAFSAGFPLQGMSI